MMNPGHLPVKVQTGEIMMMREKIKELSEEKRLIIAALLIIVCIAANIGMRL